MLVKITEITISKKVLKFVLFRKKYENDKITELF